MQNTILFEKNNANLFINIFFPDSDKNEIKLSLKKNQLNQIQI